MKEKELKRLSEDLLKFYHFIKDKNKINEVSNDISSCLYAYDIIQKSGFINQWDCKNYSKKEISK